MAQLDSHYVLAPSLEMYFVDKDSGLPMAGGTVYFYEDNEPNIPKPVFELSLVGGVYIYTPLPNPVTLSAVGTFQDGNGNNVLPYYYPYDQFGNVQLYYIEVYNSAGVFQFSRSAWPNFITNNVEEDQDVTNFIPNGQFLLHNNPISGEPLSGAQVKTTLAYGGTVGTLDVWEIAQGGWTFEKNSGSSSVDNVTFFRYGSATQLPTSNPRYAVQINTTTMGSDTSKDLCIKFPNVNKFSTSGTSYIFYFEAQAITGSVMNIPIYVRDYYGVGGSVTFEEEITSFSLTNSIQQYNIEIVFPQNENKTIGPGDDDFVQIVIRLPTTGVQNVLFTDFALVKNNNNLVAFPYQTNAEQFDESIVGWVPTPFAPDGSNFYLPIVLTAMGATYDQSIIGQIIAKPQLAANTVNNELMMDGSTYIASDYSTLGIPYQRLANFLMTNAAAVSVTNGTTTSTLPAGYIPMFGTGSNFVSIFINATPGKFDLSMNTTSVSNSVNDQTSGFTHTSADPLYVFTVPAVPTAGTYFSFTPNTGGALVYNVYFTVNGSGTVPVAPSGANILVALVTADTIATTIAKIAKAVNGYQFQLIDLRGYFLRGLDPSATTDPDAATRTVRGIQDNTNQWTGALLGSYEAAAFAAHTHPPLAPTTSFLGLSGGSASLSGGGTRSDVATTGSRGGSETRPVNIAVNFFIKY